MFTRKITYCHFTYASKRQETNESETKYFGSPNTAGSRRLRFLKILFAHHLRFHNSDASQFLKETQAVTTRKVRVTTESRASEIPVS